MNTPVPPASPATLMLRETHEAPAAIARLLDRNGAALARIGQRLRAAPPSVVVTCARGSSDHAATYGKYLIETLTGTPVASHALSVSSLYAARVRAEGALCIAISQSGRSPDLLSAVAAHRRGGAYTVALVNDVKSPLAAEVDEAIALEAGPELSVAATKSFIAALGALAALTARWTQDAALLAALPQLPAALDAVLATTDPQAALPMFRDVRNLFAIGRGLGLGIAQEVGLKFKETCGLHAEGFSSAEIRHGPMAIVEDGFPVLGFATSGPAGQDVREALSLFASRGARTHLFDTEAMGIATHPVLEPLLLIQAFYPLAEALSRARGLDPDSPPHLRKVTQTV